jgi:hypothetical protein
VRRPPEAMMRLSRPAKLALIALTVLPFLYLLVFFAQVFLSIGSGDSIIFKHWTLFFAMHLGVMLLGFLLITFYIVYLFKTDRVKPEQKAL